MNVLSLREQVERLQAENDDLKSLIDSREITSDTQNANILNLIRNNDPTFHDLWLCNFSVRSGTSDYCPEGSLDMELLGHFISQNTQLETLGLTTSVDQDTEEDNLLVRSDLMEQFFKVLSRNTSIRSLVLCGCDLSRGATVECMGTFFRSSDSLNLLHLAHCGINADACRLLSLALKGCTQFSLRHFKLKWCNTEDDQSARIIAALDEHRHLEVIDFEHNRMGRKGCDAVATILDKLTNLHTLNLRGNHIDDEGLETLTHALANGSILQEILLDENRITAKGWALLPKLFCDTTSVNKTFLSNHYLRAIFLYEIPTQAPSDLIRNLKLNRLHDKKKVAMIKIMRHHDDFDMRPLFEWDFKVLPLVLRWLERASFCPTGFEKNIGQRKLSVIYQFVRGMPIAYIKSLGASI